MTKCSTSLALHGQKHDHQRLFTSFSGLQEAGHFYYVRYSNHNLDLQQLCQVGRGQAMKERNLELGAEMNRKLV